MAKELYRFVENELVWTLTSADAEEVYDSETYDVQPGLSRTETEQKNELSRANIEVTLPLSSSLGMRYLRSVVDASLSLTIRSKDESDVYKVEWKGRLAGVKPTENASIKLVFESIFTSMRRPGLRRRFQRTCPHVLYGRNCKVVKEDFEVIGDVTDVDGINVTMAAAAGYADGYFRGGILEGPDGVMRFISAHIGSALTLIRPLDSLSLAFLTDGIVANTSIFPGCNRTKETCKDKFDNIDNNGSFPWIPTKNPVGGQSIT